MTHAGIDNSGTTNEIGNRLLTDIGDTSMKGSALDAASEKTRGAGISVAYGTES